MSSLHSSFHSLGFFVITLIGFWLATGVLAWIFLRYVMIPGLMRFLRWRGVGSEAFEHFLEILSRRQLIPTYALTGMLAFLYTLSPYFFKEIPFIIPLTKVLFLISISAALLRSLDAYSDYHLKYRLSTSLGPITPYVQALKLLVIGLTALAIVGIVMDFSFKLILGSLGAISAILLLFFQDAILGLVGGVSLTRSHLIQKNDWVVIPGQGADGQVVDINLYSLQVRNWDGVMVSVPISKLMKESFQNYAQIVKEDCRRIRRAFYLDPRSIQKLSALPEGLPLSKEARSMLGDALESSSLTNLTLFRARLLDHLKSLKLVDLEKSLLVRHLDPLPNGALPVEITAFIKSAQTPIYEEVRSALFEFVFAHIEESGLKLYSGSSS